MTDRERLEYLVYIMIEEENISYSCGKEILNIKLMEDFNSWFDNYDINYWFDRYMDGE